LPSLDLEIKIDEGGLWGMSSEEQASEWPEEILNIVKEPMIKVSEQTAKDQGEKATGLASGIRSALVSVEIEGEEVLLRLKGCGNNDQGFLMPGGHKEIRGCQFESSAFRECYF